MQFYTMSKHKTIKRGRPRDISSPIKDKNDPDNYPTLASYLEAQGRITHITHAQILRGRFLYMRGYSAHQIATDLNIDASIVDRWALIFAWDEERDKRLFNEFRKVTSISGPYAANLSERHERIAGGIEQYAEKILQGAANGKLNITSRDLATLASTIKSTQEIRKTARGENIKKTEDSVNVNLKLPSSLERIANAMVDAYDAPRLTEVKSRTIAIGAEDSIGRDTEHEIVLSSVSPSDRYKHLTIHDDLTD
jgi:hypothetical protein